MTSPTADGGMGVRQTTMAVEPTPRVVASSGTPAVQQPLLTPGFPPLPSFQCPFSTASPRHATVSADNARPGLMERFTAPQLQYPRPTLSQTLSMHAAMPPPRMSPLGGSAITGDAYTQRHGLPGSLDARLVSTPTATATKAAQHQVTHHHQKLRAWWGGLGAMEENPLGTHRESNVDIQMHD